MPAPHDDFATACARACPGFRARGAPRRAFKSELLDGDVDGLAVVGKRVVRTTAVWTWYFAREVALYEAFAATPLPIRAPALVGARDGVLVVTRVPGAALATQRHPAVALATATVHAFVALRAALAAWPGRAPATLPTPAVRAQLRERLLEDPTAPLVWIRSGIARCARRGLIGADAARRMDDALADHAPVAFGHGDLLLRNSVAEPDGTLGLVDWECAGPHVYDWDLALLWSQLAPDARAVLEAAIGSEPRRRRAFLALAAFALAREVRFARSFAGARPGALAHRRAELDAVAARLH